MIFRHSFSQRESDLHIEPEELRCRALPLDEVLEAQAFGELLAPTQMRTMVLATWWIIPRITSRLYPQL